ncbi:AAA family ATPase [Desulfonatronospira sp.]|uniref:AAA family ATPase n=1 Tax=Desulfonatronospira sp. TaxID=1962951 RepID=UPI0025B8FD98|nr:AAA family ATPase [Desulfonatronospira sp.]
MRITSLKSLSGCGVFHDFSWPSDLPGFGRYNIIYGWNGTGKTTLSRIFRALEQRITPAIGKTTVCIDETDFSCSEFPQARIPIRVFNRDFVNESIFPLEGGNVPPIYVIGPESANKQKEVEKLKEKRGDAESDVNSAKTKRQEAERALDRYSQDRARVIKDTLRSSGQNPYNNYNKSDFHDRALKMLSDKDAANHLLSDTDRENLLAQHQATLKPKLSECKYQMPDLQELASITSNLLAKTVLSETIESLKNDHNLNDWIRQGLGLHKERQADICLFCEQPLPEGRVAALEAHFSAEYEHFVKALNEYISSLKAMLEKISELKLPNKAELYDDMAAEYESAEQSLQQEFNKIRSFLEALIDAFENKKTKVFDKLHLEITIPETKAELPERLNEVIRKHNKASDEFQDRVSSARDRLALNLIAADIDEFSRLCEEVQQASNEKKQADKKVEALNSKVTEIEKTIIEHRQPAEELNKDLRKYLGHNELQLKVEKTGYKIIRNDEPAEDISEGEITAISLLYFLKTLRDRSFDLENGVVVLDDPVSSLDANALYYAFGFMREYTAEAGQLFILTHNFAFFQQVQNWFNYFKGRKQPNTSQKSTRFYMTDCTNKGNKRCSKLTALDPLLEQYNSEYHYLFARIYRKVQDNSKKNLEEYYIFPNMARRVLETFLSFRCPQIKGGLRSKLHANEFDQSKKTRILRFVHTHSHSGAIGEPEHDMSILSETNSVLNDLLDFMKYQDEKHFLAMEQLVKSTYGGEEGE